MNFRDSRRHLLRALRSRGGVLWSLVSLVALGGVWPGEYWVVANKPWFTLPVWGLAVLWLGVGVSLWRGYEEVHADLRLFDSDLLQRLYLGLWIGYTGGLYLLLRVGVPSLTWLVMSVMLGVSGYVIATTYETQPWVGLALRGVVYILSYFWLVSLYIVVQHSV